MREALREWLSCWEDEPTFGMVEIVLAIVILGTVFLWLANRASSGSRYPVQQVSTIDRP